MCNKARQNLQSHVREGYKAARSSYILLCFNNENKMMDAIYKSAMEDIGESLQMKSQQELFGKSEQYIFDGSKKKVKSSKYHVYTTVRRLTNGH